MSTIKLWFSPGACSLAPHILLNEIGLPFDSIKVAIKDGAHLTPEFARLNPKHRLPVLALDEEVITELPAIATAISHLKPERHLMGKSALDQARVYEWMNWLSGTVHAQGFGCIWRPHRFTDDPQMHAAITAKGHKTVGECFAMIDGKLLGPHAVGGALTAVDAFLLVMYRWGHRIGLDMRKTYANFTRLADDLAQRPSVMRTLSVEEISIDAVS